MKEIAAELLLGIEPRGQDATGMAWFGKGDGMVVDKLNVRATMFTGTGIKMNDDAPTAVLHTRMATTGHPKNNRNNHPIVAPGQRGSRVVGTHNGWVNNYASLTRLHDLPRNAEVDSEVIFSFLSKYDDDYDKLGNAIDGNYSLAYLREDRPGTLFLVRGHSSPLILSVTNHGIFYASTESALRGIEQYVGGPLVGYIDVAEGRAVRVENGEVVDTISFDLRDRWSTYYGNQVHKRTVPTRVSWPDEDEWRGARSWTTDSRGVTHLPNSTNSYMLNAYTDLSKGVRLWFGSSAEERAEFLGLDQKEGAEVASAYGKYRWNDTPKSVEFSPWPVDSEMATDEAVLEDLMFLTVDMDRDKLPDTLRYELNLLSGRLDRKSPSIKREGLVLKPGYYIKDKYVYTDTDRLVPYEELETYVKVQGKWYFVQADKLRGYVVHESTFQADTDHLNPRTVTPPAALTADGEGVADYCLIGESIWAQDEEGNWTSLNLSVGDLSDEELRAIVGDSCEDDDEAQLTIAGIEEVNALVERGLGTKVG